MYNQNKEPPNSMVPKIAATTAPVVLTRAWVPERGGAGLHLNASACTHGPVLLLAPAEPVLINGNHMLVKARTRVRLHPAPVNSLLNLS